MRCDTAGRVPVSLLILDEFPVFLQEYHTLNVFHKYVAPSVELLK